MPPRHQFISAFALLVDDYDAAISFYTGPMGFELIEDLEMGTDATGAVKRWVLVAPPGSRETRILLARAANDQQKAAIGNQTGGRVGFFLHSNDFAGDHAAMLAAGVHFEEPPRHEPYGTVAVFQDPWGNRWDLLQLK